jgi:flagellar motor switch protein FliG
MAAPAPALKDPPRYRARKAAILLLALGDEMGTAILRELNEGEVEAVVSEIASLGNVPKNERQKIVQEFIEVIVSDQFTSFGGSGAAERMLGKAFGTEGSRRYVDLLRKHMEDEQEADGENAASDLERLIQVLKLEHPQAVALFLARLPIKRQAAVMEGFSIEFCTEVGRRLASMQDVSPDIADHVTAAIQAKLEQVPVSKRKSYGGARAMAELCNHLPPAVADELLEKLQEEDSEMAEEIRTRMFTFEDILGLDVSAIEAINQQVERTALTLALKGTSEEMKEHFMQQMSKRARAMLVEDMDALGAVRIKDVQEAQREIIQVVHELNQDGAISIRGTEAEEFVT